MSLPQPSDPQLLKMILKPLLEDFQYWFGRSRTLLESENLPFLADHEQSDLLARLKQAQQEVSTAQLMFQTLNHQVGIELATLRPWHRLVAECWQVSQKRRIWQANQTEGNTTLS